VADERGRSVINHEVRVEEPPVEEPRREARETFPEEAGESPRRAKARSYFRQHPMAKWVLLFFIVAVIVAGVLIWHYYSIRESTDDAQIDGYITPVSARVGGTAIQVNFEENQLVHEGDVLVQLDPRDYQVAVDRARAELNDALQSARAARTGVPIARENTASQLENSRANVAAAQKEVNAAEARLREAQANHTKAAQDLERFRVLVAKDEVPRQQYDTAVANEQGARASVEAAQAAVATAQSHVVQAEAQVRSAQTAPQQVAVTEARAGSAGASAEKSQAAVAQAELNLQYTTVKAPVTGVVSKRNVQVGQVVQPGQPLVAVVDLSNLWVTANFKETQLKKMRVGQGGTIHVDALDQDFNGHVDSFGAATGARFSLLPPENATGNYVKVVQHVPVKVVFDKGQDFSRMRPGMSVEVTIITK